MTTIAPHTIPVALESGKTRIFASALEWPGWTRSGRDESTALEALLASGPRYQRAVGLESLLFQAPTTADAFRIIERLTGDSTTDFGAPNRAAVAEAAPLDAAELARFQRILHACWQELAGAVASASGKHLRKGPRGGGRGTEQLLDHILESHYGYLRRIAWREREPQEHGQDVALRLAAITQATEQALAFAVSDQMPKAGPRGGTFWTPRYFVRRSAWHILDHIWEMEDKLEP
jgi:uncharacterized damage-inducible protein DinB